MGLSITHIAFADFRNYERFELGGIGDLTVFVGPNAVGKTNIVEGVQLLTAQTSFRHPTGLQLVRDGARVANLRMSAEGEGRQLDVRSSIAEGKRTFSVNGKAKRAADLKGLLPSVAFTPDDLMLAKGSMTVRRNALDAVGSQLSRNHYLIRRDFDKVLRQKNALLKEEADQVLVESINELMVTCGAQLSCYRSALFAKLVRYMSSYYGEISGRGERLRARYAPSWFEEGAYLQEGETLCRDDARHAMSKALAAKLPAERARRRSLVGPHADRVEFLIDGRPAEVFGSQGQQRSLVLSFKLAEVSLLRDMLGQNPILLLDDVMSELDEGRRRALVQFVSGGIQTFITTANIDYFDKDLLASARTVQLPVEPVAKRAEEGR